MLVLRFLNFLFDISCIAAGRKVRKITVIADDAKVSCVTYAVLRSLYNDVKISMSRCFGVVGDIPVTAVCT